MAQAWFFNIPFHGHINPTLPLVQELVSQGDEVIYFSGPRFEQQIRATGAEYREYDGPYVFEQSRTVAHAVHQGSQVAEATSALLPQVMAAVAQEEPDYLLFDMSAPWGNIASQRFSIPAVASFPHLPFSWRTLLSDPRVFRKGWDSLRPGLGYYRELRRRTSKLAKEHHLRKAREINVLSSSAELNIVFSSRYFQPYPEGFDNSYQFVGPIIDTARADSPMQLARNNEQQLVYIAVGTVYRANQQFFQQCLQAFDDERFAVVMSVGAAVDPADLGPVPRNFTVAQYVPQLAVLQEADLFVTHGGMNSINEAVMALVPMIVVPNTIEQAVNASRVEQLHAGLYLEPERATAEQLRRTADQILTDRQVPHGLDLIRQSFLDAGGVEQATIAIQDLKRKHGLL